MWLYISLARSEISLSPVKRKEAKRLVSLFNGISTFVGYLIPKLFLKNSSEAI